MQMERVLELERIVVDLTAERDALVSLSESYEEGIERLSAAYATAASRLERSLELANVLTYQYRDIAKVRAESITKLLHGDRAVAGLGVLVEDSGSDHSPMGKIEALISQRERRLTAVVRKHSFWVARVVTCFTDGSFRAVEPPLSSSVGFQTRVDYLGRLDRELERITGSHAYRLRFRIRSMFRNVFRMNQGQNKR